jgi:hypothetical protein
MTVTSTPRHVRVAKLADVAPGIDVGKGVAGWNGRGRVCHHVLIIIQLNTCAQ